MSDNLSVWNSVKRPPKDALRSISFGALKGKSDIDPMWRIKAMTEQFGPCGIGWKYEIKRIWNEPAPGNQTFAFAEVAIYIRDGETWSDGIPGVGGNMLAQIAKGNVKENDEGYKMAVTDALGNAMRNLGVAADIYMGKFDGSKYVDEKEEVHGFVSGDDLENIKNLVEKFVPDEGLFLTYVGAESIDRIPLNSLNKALAALNKKRVAAQRQPGEEG